MPWFVSRLGAAGAGVLLGVVSIAFGVREKEWPRPTRALAVIFGLSLALAGLFEVVTIIYVIGCEPAMSCL
ncbi:MAG TPA: hypothetical protein VFE16_06520 [Candidatus Cybelea sp.]|jgi:hypothetical protein|nr:hypothetical protein [Candidatus Cybelea sp.]